MQQVTILGSTGSIGKSTLDVLAKHPEDYSVYALTANRNVDVLAEQIEMFKPVYVVMADEASAQQLQEKIGKQSQTSVLSGSQAIVDIAKSNESQIVMAAIVGSAGLLPTLAAIQAGKKVLLANKEALVMSGAYFMQEAKKAKASLLPVDSEHNAIFQCLPHTSQEKNQGVNKIILTASGGPFRQKALHELESVTPDQACAHPNWEMGRKISVDSATMMNKGLELIEAHWLFDMPTSKIDVLIHPESIIHSMVAYNDGSVLAQLGNPDMCTPIAHALAWPKRIETNVEALDLSVISALHFEKPDMQRFSCLKLAYEVIDAGDSASIIYNAANEVAVEAFLNQRIAFTDISAIIADALEQIKNTLVSNLDDILHVHEETNLFVHNHLLKKYSQ